MKITETYTGSDATLEILIMLFGAFLLGYLLRYLYDKYFTECVEEEVVEVPAQKDDIREEVKAPVVENTTAEIQKTVSLEDDLKIIEGIGPKIESLLKSVGIKTFEKLSNVTPDQIREILKEKGGDRYAFHDPTTWPDQARLAYEGRMEELKEYQEFLRGGRI